mgnify:CR=1 FL=1
MARELLAGQKNNQYRIIIGRNSISQKNISSFTNGHKKLLIISDTGVPKNIIQNIASLSKLKSKVFTVILDQGEKAKSIANFQKIINFLIAHNFDRSDGIIAIGGGVSANSGIRTTLKVAEQKYGWKTYVPKFEYTTDNAAMIAMVAHYKYLNQDFTPLNALPFSRMD